MNAYNPCIIPEAEEVVHIVGGAPQARIHGLLETMPDISQEGLGLT